VVTSHLALSCWRPALPTCHHLVPHLPQAELAAAETLLEALDPSAGGEERELLEAARGHLGELAGSYMACLRQLLSVNSTSMEEVPKKLAFCKSRIQQVGLEAGE
jgi:hypothetical protein